ncbi:MULTISPECIES: DUF2147 domain-containing protein [unclassified Acidisoma]|jgi:uncharacterized protein (DUF2147 family)|uniref:DUF2147 domain-containing protein n=1 Tax=unclassified Acidisoma TaxID=2634065 RepID=UPI00131A7F08|nr:MULTISPECIES: DUF2147 domain-containing protein [unclassified Acidisoma]
MRKFLVLCLFLLGSAASAVAQTNAPNPAGLWVTNGRDAVVQIYPCGTGGTLCGALVGFPFDHPTDPAPMTWNNKPQCRFPFITQLMPRRHSWGGFIVDPQNGHKYNAKVRVMSENVLRLRGYLFFPALGAKRIWTRYMGPPPPPDCRMAADALKK